MRFSPFAALLLAAQPLAAQVAEPTPIAPAAQPAAPQPVLTLEEAIALARRNNPLHLQTVNAQRRAGAQLLAARGGYLPRVDASFGSQYREGRTQFFNGVALGATSDILSSSYSLSAQQQISGATFITPKLQKAELEAAEADVRGSTATLTALVAQQYLSVLQAQARAELQDTLLRSAQLQLELARAREAVGAATSLDTRRAEVQYGQVRVAAITARNTVEVEKLRLFEQIGVAQPAGVELTTSFTVALPQESLDQLLDRAQRANPTLNAVRSREDVANLGYRRAQSGYLPTLSLYTELGGYTNQMTDEDQVLDEMFDNISGQCRGQAQLLAIETNTIPDYSACPTSLSADQRAAALRANDQFPFTFTKNPWVIQAQVSIPIFDGFTREQRVQEAAAYRSDARYALRAAELKLTADVTSAYLNLTTSAQTVAIQEQNARTAREALLLAEERYRVGAATFVEVTQAQADYEQAETDRINAVYDYHKYFAALESAVGGPLR
ncbi:MAG TPA: TolC family protein [Gemmatimonadaceae bacterium]